MKDRKRRTTGQDMCSCFRFGCDPFGASPLFREKIDRRHKKGLCGACGAKPKLRYGNMVCKCKNKKELKN